MAPAIDPAAPIYKVIFVNQNQVYEIFCRQIYQSDMWGFIEVEEFVFGERSAILVDPGTTVAGLDGYVRIADGDPAFPPGAPVRVYYRVPGTWAVERHAAARGRRHLLPLAQMVEQLRSPAEGGVLPDEVPEVRPVGADADLDPTQRVR